MTEKLYYTDPTQYTFTARVLACTEGKNRWEVELDRTAFFPEGGGQGGDVGALQDAAVTDTHERGGVILHFCDRPLPVGDTVNGAVDAVVRFARMQIHSGEHIVSGTAHREWGCENVGFHMTEHAAVIDLDRELDAAQLSALERMANEAVWDDIRVNILWPMAKELETFSFRQKKELAGQIRLVEIPGVDLCACCAPHVRSTGQVGEIRFTDAMRHRGGMRLTMVAGRAAYLDALAMRRNAETVSRIFSVPRGEIGAAAERFSERESALDLQRAALEKKYVALRAASLAAAGEDILCFEDASLSAAALRDLAGALSEKCSGTAGAFAGEDGNWRYVLASRREDLRIRGKAFNAALRGRGGGSSAMIQGGVNASREEIERYFHGEN